MSAKSSQACQYEGGRGSEGGELAGCDLQPWNGGQV